MKITIKQNKNNLIRNEKITSNKFLNELIDITIENKDNNILLYYIRKMLYVDSKTGYNQIFNHYKNFPEYYQLFKRIYVIFIKLNLNEKNISNYRGAFLEVLTFKILSELYQDQSIYKESKICWDNYESHYFDILVNLDEYINSYECKFSSNSLKRKNIDSMIGLSNKIDNINLFLVFFDFSENIVSSLNMLKGETNPEKYLEMINEFNFVCLDNISNNEAFIA